jgi:hypothetical protein
MVFVVAAAGAQSFSYYDGEYTNTGPPPGVPGPNSITQSNDTATITQFNSVSCNAGGLHTDNTYMRRFALNADHGIVGAFTVQSLDWAIESAAGAGGSQPVSVNLYSIPSGAALTFANLTPIGNSAINVNDAALAAINTPVNGVVADPTTTDLVVEVFTPNGQAAGNSLFIGSNPNGQTAPGYLAAPDCGISEPTDTAAIGFPDMHIIMVVNGDEAGPVPTMGGWSLVLLVVLMAGIAVWVMRRRSLEAV